MTGVRGTAKRSKVTEYYAILVLRPVAALEGKRLLKYECCYYYFVEMTLKDRLCSPDNIELLSSTSRIFGQVYLR